MLRARKLLVIVCAGLPLVIVAAALLSCKSEPKRTDAPNQPRDVVEALAPLPLPQGHKRRTVHNQAFIPARVHVAEGSEARAKRYYREKVATQMKFPSDTPDVADRILTSNLQDMLNYFGYSSVRPSELHALSSDALMAKSPAPDDILATRFFAPKITRVTQPRKDIPDGGFGWRKLVRFKARPDSAAHGRGIRILFVLQNSFESDPAVDPFNPDKNVAFFNQVIAVRTEQPIDDVDNLPMYFFTYGEFVKVDGQGKPVKDANGNFQDAAPLIFSLKATFDSRDPDSNLGVDDYFVPDACYQCHGGASTPKANFLDTDHWQDRVTPQYGLTEARFQEEDFTALAANPFGVLRDGGVDRKSDQYKRAFAVIHKLNLEIRDQNAVFSAVDNFQLDAVNAWLRLHDPASGNDPTGTHHARHVPPYERSIGSLAWEPQNESHRKILYYLNRYCYRCHSSVKYDVFDRKEVVRLRDASGGIPKRIKELNDSNTWMPQDRPFPGLTAGEPSGDLKEFLDLLAALPANP